MMDGGKKKSGLCIDEVDDISCERRAQLEEGAKLPRMQLGHVVPDHVT